MLSIFVIKMIAFVGVVVSMFLMIFGYEHKEILNSNFMVQVVIYLICSLLVLFLY